MKVYFEPYGCTLNYGESRIMEEQVEASGHETVQQIQEADIIVLVTCTVIETTENKMLRQLREFSKCNKPVIVAGCMAAVQADTILNALPSAQLITPDKISTISEIISSITKKLDLTDEDIVKKSPPPPQASIDAIIPISNGCLGRCTYCITRLARGELSSHPIENVLADISKALSQDLKEVRLTAQDTAVYGLDQHTSLPNLLKQIDETFSTNHDFRIRVGMMNPNTAQSILDDLVTQYSSERVFKFLHLPVQSGDNEILTDMKRGYKVQDFMDIVKKFRQAFPALTLSTDIIIGYPGETEPQFQKSVELVHEIQPNIVNITRFSARPGTEAYNRKDKIHGRIQKERSRILTKTRFEISKNLNDQAIGETKRILITEFGKDNSVMGRADNYQPVVVKQKLKLGTFKNVDIVDATDSYLIGEIL